MNIYQLIQQAITDTNADVDLTFKEKSRAEADTQNYTRANINILPVINGIPTFGKARQIDNSVRYSIEFKQLDEWDNPDYSGADANTFAIIEEMRILMNSIFYAMIYKDGSPILTDNPISWTYSHINRETSNTMSGVRCTITLPFIDNKVCSY